MNAKLPLIQKMLAAGMLFAAFLLSLTDFYFMSAGIAPFPILGLLLLQPLVFFFSRRVKEGKTQSQLEATGFGLILIAFYFLSALWGWFAFGGVFFKAAIGMSLGIVVFLNVLLRENNRLFRETLFRVLNMLLVVHLLFWVVQVLYFSTTAEYLDYIQPVSGLQTRSKFNRMDLKLVRFTGLFAEPAVYATFMYMGLSVRLLANKFRWRVFDFLLAATVVFSLSILGIALLGLLVVVSALYDRRSALLFSAGFGVLVPTLATVLFSTDTPVSLYLRLRFTKPLDDPSGNERLVSGFTGFAESPDVIQVLGKGLGNYDMGEKLTNGLAYLLDFVGAAGTAFFLGMMFLLLIRRRVSAVAILLFSATFAGTPLFTNLYWWFWLALVLVYSRYPLAASEAEQSSYNQPA